MRHLGTEIIKWITLATMVTSLFSGCMTSRIDKDRDITRPFPPNEDIKNELAGIEIASIEREGTSVLRIDFKLAENLKSDILSRTSKENVVAILRVIKDMNLGYESFKIRGLRCR